LSIIDLNSYCNSNNVVLFLHNIIYLYGMRVKHLSYDYTRKESSITYSV
jgi:hypothetical protein